MAVIPLFPLNLVLFPSVPLPLHIFEERYRAMINHCIETETPFGVVLRQGENFRRVGCSAVVNEVLERYDDGRLDILSIGADRFAIDSIDDAGLYLEAQVRYLDELSGESRASRREEALAQIRKYAFYAEISLDQRSLEALTTTQLSYLIAGLDVIGMDAKQELLEVDSAEERLAAAIEALKVGMERLIAQARLRKITGTDIDISGLLN
ncbi:MAG: LON peptidase substrate-binding domain-containing protein [Spirochaetales bacterium]